MQEMASGILRKVITERRNAITEPMPVSKGWRKASARRRHDHQRRAARSHRSHQGAVTSNSVRLVVLGAAEVGKTCLVTRFLSGRCPETYTPTVEDMHCGQWCAHGVRWNMEVLDTAGAFCFPAMRRLAIDTGRIFLLVYSVDDEESFEEVRRLREQVLAQRGADRKTPIVVVGNKCDVEEGRRFLSAQTSDLLVTIEWGHYYVETSAMDGVNVEKAFTDILLELVEKDEDEVNKRVFVTERPPPGPPMLACLNQWSCM